MKSLLRLNGQGMMFLSCQGFDAGTRLGIRVDLRTIRVDLGVAKPRGSLSGDLLLRVEGFIAECHTVGEQLYQVTFLFDRMREADRLILRSIEGESDLVASKGVVTPPVRDWSTDGGPGLN